MSDAQDADHGQTTLDGGFSPLGLAVSVAVFAPNLLLLVFSPREAQPIVRVPRPVSWLEREGLALCLVVPTITALTGYYKLWGATSVAAEAGRSCTNR